MNSMLIWQKRKKYFPLILFVAPLFGFWIYSMWVNPSRNYFVNDAVFPYFLNSLSVFKGETYRYVDHPGTPVEVFGSILLGLTYPFLINTKDGFVLYHLQNPNLFFSLANYFLVLTNISCLFVFFFLARRFIKNEDSTLAASLAVMYFSIHAGSLGASLIWNHNSFSFPIGTLLLLFLLRTLYDKNDSRDGLPMASMIGLGIGAGILASFTIYLLAWLVGVLAVIFLYYLFKRLPLTQTLTALTVTGVSGIAGFFLATLPVLDKLPVFFNWILRIFTHTSRYLSVPEHEPSYSRVYNNFINLGYSLPSLFIATVITLLLVIIIGLVSWRKISENPGGWALIGGLTIQTSLLLFILLDRPSRDAYFLSLAAILPVLMLAVSLVLQSNSRLYRIFSRGVSLLVMVGVINTTITGISNHVEETSSLVAAEAKISETIDTYALKTGRSTDDIVVLWMHDTYSTCWGLRLGNLKAGKVFTPELDIICKNQYQLRNDFRVVMPDQSHRLKEIKWDIIFTCERWAKAIGEYSPSIVLEVQPDFKWTCGNMLIAYTNAIP